MQIGIHRFKHSRELSYISILAFGFESQPDHKQQNIDRLNVEFERFFYVMLSKIDSIFSKKILKSATLINLLYFLGISLYL